MRGPLRAAKGYFGGQLSVRDFAVFSVQFFLFVDFEGLGDLIAIVHAGMIRHAIQEGLIEPAKGSWMARVRGRAHRVIAW